MSKKFTTEEAKAIGDKISIDWNEVDLEQFRMGLEVEMEHGSRWGDATNVTKDDPNFTGRIAWAHLKEIPDYYTRLAKMESLAAQISRDEDTQDDNAVEPSAGEVSAAEAEKS